MNMSSHRFEYWLASALLILSSACSQSPKATQEAWCNDWQILVRDSMNHDGKVSDQYEGAWFPGDMTPDKRGIRPYYEAVGAHVGILELHPVSATEPAKLKFKGTLSPASSVLTVTAGGTLQGDGLLQCWVNGRKIGEYLLDGSQWSKCQFDLSSFSGRDVDLQLRIAAGGKDIWNFENLFIDDIAFSSQRLETRVPTPVPPSLSGTNVAKIYACESFRSPTKNQKHIVAVYRYDWPPGPDQESANISGCCPGYLSAGLVPA